MRKNVLLLINIKIRFFLFFLIAFFPSLTFAGKIIQVPLEITLEKETAKENPDYKKRLLEIVNIVNDKASEAGIERRFYIKEILPTFDKKEWSDTPNNVPDLFFNHEIEVVYIVIDTTVEGISQTYFWLPSIIMRGKNTEIFGEKGWYVFAHELMHTVGAEDLYLLNIDFTHNYVLSVPYKNRYYDCIMSKYGSDSFSTYTTELVNRGTFPPSGLSWYKYQPPRNVFVSYDINRKIITNAFLEIYRSSTLDDNTVEIDTTPEWSGKTNSSGEFAIDEYLFSDRNRQGEFSYSGVLLVKVSKQDDSFWGWLEITQVNELYWKGYEEVGEFSIYTDIEIAPYFEAEWLEQTQGSFGLGSPLEIKPGKKTKVIAKFKNTGSVQWDQQGENRIGFYVYKDQVYSTPPEYSNPTSLLFGRSFFADLSWGSSYDGSVPSSRAALLKEDKVLPGEIGTFEFTFSTPSNSLPNPMQDDSKTPYREDFYREDLTLAYGPNWMKNVINGDPLGFSHVWFPIRVVE